LVELRVVEDRWGDGGLRGWRGHVPFWRCVCARLAGCPAPS
jgi:hypothetical protein